MQDVDGRVAFITGRRRQHLDESAALFASQGLDVHATQLDVTDRDAVCRAAEETERRFGRVHVLVNNAGIGLAGPVAQARQADWDWVIDVNIKGVGHGLQAFLPRIRAHGEGGHIVNTASMGGLLPVSAGLYCMTKAAIIALSETLHIELAAENIGVSAYCPGPVLSNIASGVAARPQRYSDSGYAPPDPARAARAAAMPYMSPIEAGERVLEGVRRNDLFILTHPEFRDGVAERAEMLLNAFPDEPLNAERASAITFLTSHPVYAGKGKAR